MKVVITRLEEKYVHDLEKIEREEHAERSEVMRRLLAQAIQNWKIQKALALLKARRATLRKAAELAEVSYVEMLDLASRNDISIGYSLQELRRDLVK